MERGMRVCQRNMQSMNPHVPLKIQQVKVIQGSRRKGSVPERIGIKRKLQQALWAKALAANPTPPAGCTVLLSSRPDPHGSSAGGFEFVPLAYPPDQTPMGRWRVALSSHRG